MTDIQAALGIVQLKKLDGFNRKRIENAEYLNKHIDIEGLIKPHKENNVKHVYHQYAVRIENDKIDRNAFMKYLTGNGIGCAIHYPLPVYRQPLYQELGYAGEEINCPVSEKLANTVVSLPVHPSLTGEDLKYIVSVINNFGEIK